MTMSPELYIGKVIEIECNEILKSGKPRHPRFKRFRDDKKVQDIEVLEDLKKGVIACQRK